MLAEARTTPTFISGHQFFILGPRKHRFQQKLRRPSVTMVSPPAHHALFGPIPTILLTNDDGIQPESALILPLAQRLVTLGHDVVVCAPGKNNSACGHGITLGTNITIRRHRQYEKRFAASADAPAHIAELHVFSIDEGTPADCVIAAIQPRTGLLARLQRWPQLTLSAVNYGQNMASDIIYSGTFAAARQAAMYGIPALASSVDLFHPDLNNPSHAKSCERAIQATIEITKSAIANLPDEPDDAGRQRPANYDSVLGKSMSSNDRLMHAFCRGDIVLNLNVPLDWQGQFQTTRLDCVMYRAPVSLPCVPTGLAGDEKETISVCIKGSSGEYMHARGSDSAAVSISKVASVTPVSTWPITHPLALSDTAFEEAIREGLRWLPCTSKERTADKL